jgi:cytochrome c biogenesis protein CcmG, thiol:disulfide interchange protein DsbE
MKPTACLTLLFLICFATVFAQNELVPNPIGLKKLPSVELKSLDNKSFNTADISNNGKPIIISFWATWCKPCVNELTTIADVYDDWKEETGVKLIAISIDDSKTSGNVSPLVNGKSWDYEVYLDVNSDFRRAMNVNLIPQTFVINGNNEIVWQHTSFSQGSELELIDIVRKVAKGETLPAE